MQKNTHLPKKAGKFHEVTLHYLEIIARPKLQNFILFIFTDVFYIYNLTATQIATLSNISYPLQHDSQSTGGRVEVYGLNGPNENSNFL
jgi:hypothetical protein